MFYSAASPRMIIVYVGQALPTLYDTRTSRKLTMSFDADAFLNSAVTGSNSTKVIPCPIGEYPGVVDKLNVRQWQSKDGTTTGLALDVTWLVEDDNAKTVTGRDNVTARQGIMLDLTPDGGLDMSEGKNVGLGRLRAALNLNNEGEAFSFNMMPGRMAKIKVGHREDNRDPEIKYAEVNAVIAM